MTLHKTLRVSLATFLLLQFVDWSEGLEFGSSFRDCDLLVTESVLSLSWEAGEQLANQRRVLSTLTNQSWEQGEQRERDRECVYIAPSVLASASMTVRR